MERRGIVSRCAAAVAVLVVAAGVRVAGASDSGAAVVAEVSGLEDARRAALVASDSHALERLVAADCSYIHSNGISQSRGDLLGMLTRGDIRYVAFTVEAVEYRAYGATVVGTGVQSINLTNAGKPFVSRSRYTVVYAPTAGGLAMVAYQSTPLPEIVMQEKKE